jgi:hypothetical protein
MSMVYQYSVFGLVVSSQIPLPELLPLSQPINVDHADITIVWGSVPHGLDQTIIQTPGYQASQEACLVTLGPIARCMAMQGRTLVVEPAPTIDALSLRTFIVNTGLVALLQQRRGMVLQASALRWGNGAILFVAASSAGKSTLVAQFSELEYPILTDETAFITFDDRSKPVVQPGYPALKLWPDMLAKLRPDWPEPVTLRPGLDKKIMVVPDRFWPEPLPVTGIVFLRSSTEPDVTITPVVGRDKFAFLTAASSRLGGCKSLEQTKDQFVMTGLLSSLAIYHQITRPSHLAYCDYLIEQLMVLLLENLPI